MSTDPVRHVLNGPTMGTRWSATFYATAATDAAAVRRALAAVVDRIDTQMSTWKPASDLMRFNAAAPGSWVVLPPELLHVLDRGLAIGRASGGAFDIGLGDLVAAWGFGAARGVPDPAHIRAARQAPRPPTHATLELDRAAGRARKHAPCALDLSGIAKGFAVDEMMRTLRIFGIGSALVTLDGEVSAHGTRPDGTPWVIAIEKPDHDARSAWG
ncbi:MAG: FAD:protein FMN transferase, partial [Burkholderiales bacterium]|nr:FAD:protein FMN transferase [Burkholderiales bacterium]